MIPLCDAHAHLADERIFPTRETLLDECRAHGVVQILANAAQADEWERIIELTEQPGVLGAFGIHPFWPEQWTPDAERALLAFLRDDSLRGRIVAIGEIGLDFWDGRDNAAAQIEAMANLRRTVDRLEGLVDDSRWPIPKYREMLFIH